MEQKEVKQQRPSDSIDALVRASAAKYNTWRWYKYLEMGFLVNLLKGRRSNQPRDISFENKVLWALVHSNENYREVKADPLQNDELIRLFLIKYNRGDQNTLDNKKGESAKFPGALRGLLMSLAGHLEAKTKFPCLRQMDSNSTSHMLPFLTTQEQVSLFSTCKALNERSSVFIKPINKLLSLVARSEQDKAKAMIRENPELLLQSGDITDGAGRYFKCITPLQYAAWALDAHMWTMMLPLFPDAALNNGVSVEAAHQLQALEDNGLGEHGRHFDFKPLLDAYAAFLENPSEDNWIRGVGGAQRLLPDHVVQEYTTPDRPFKPTPSFAVADARRPTAHRARGVSWWRSAVFYNGTLGVSWAAGRGALGYVQIVDARERDAFAYSIRSQCARDRAAIEALCRQRCAELTDLLRRYGVEPSSAAECKSPGRR